MKERIHLFTIPSGVPFLPELADALLGNRLLPEMDLAGDELLLARTTIYVPTRRAARRLRGAILHRLGKKAAILPNVRPLGEFDEEAAFFEGEPQPELALPMSATERILALAPLIQAWKQRLPAHVAGLFGRQEGLDAPASLADAIWLARDLAALIDSVETEEADLGRITSVVPQELAGWWQLTVEFLRIVSEFWPALLAERGRADPAAARNALIDAEAKRLAASHDAGPVIAAGSTGSIPATARLLHAIARHPKGAVVLPGLDQELDGASWTMIGHEEGHAAHGHPQFGLKRLLAQMGVARDEVCPIGEAPAEIAARRRLASEALRPADSTDLWADQTGVIGQCVAAGATDGLTLLEAANEQEEALAIAIALRRAISDPSHNAALVTADRNLARRVSAELLRFGIRADDSGGRPLASTPAGQMLRLVALAAFRPGEPEPLLDLLAHPLLLLGRLPSRARRLGALAELAALRGGRARPDIALLATAAARRREELLADRHAPAWFHRMGSRDWQGLLALLDDLAGAFAPLVRLRGMKEVQLAEAAKLLVQSFEELARDREGGLEQLYGGDEGEALAAALRNLIAGAGDLRCAPQEIPGVLDALLLPEMVRPAAAGDGRIAIWGPLEARLQEVDLLVIGGMNEGNWPRRVEAGPFLSRVIGAGIGLSPPERRIGQAAHDFQMAMGCREIVLSRALREEGAPATPSRWLQRFLAILPADARHGMEERGRRLVQMAAALDLRPRIEPATQPRPCPPLSARPQRLSVTEVETLRRDPYAVYARRILHLERLEPLSRDPGPADLGSLLHDILHRFATSGTDSDGANALAVLERIGAECLAEAELPADVHVLWSRRLARLAPQWLAWERERAAGRLASFSEARARPVEIASSGFFLSGRADRIDIYGDGAEILDFKTGSGPSKRQAHILLAPQLALEGALLQRGAFAEIGAGEPKQLAYVRLRPDGDVLFESVLKLRNSEIAADALSHRAWEQLERLAAFYSDERNGYLSRALPMREQDMGGDYDHLARVQEWLAGFAAEEAEE